MSRVAEFPSGLGITNDEILTQPMPEPSLEDVEQPTPLDILTHKRRACTAKIAFQTLCLEQKKDLYDRAAVIALHSDKPLSYIMAADRVAQKYRVRIEPCDRQTIKNSICNRVQAAKRLRDEIGATPSSPVGAALPNDKMPSQVSNKRKGRSGRKRNGDDHLPSNKLQPDCHGCRGHLAYQDVCKTYATEGAKHVNDDNWSLCRAANAMEEELEKIGVTLSNRQCIRKIKEAIENNGVGVSPKKSGGQVLPSSIEKSIANTVRALRERHFPVFPEEVIRWAAYEVEGTPLAELFPPDGKPSKGWYRGWLKRMEFHSGSLRPLEQTRAAWYTPENLEIYFDVAKDVLINAGVAEVNPNYDPAVAYSEQIIITHPERICSYDETRMEMDCTDPTKGKTDRIVKAGMGDDGTTVVTKSSKTGSACCGRLGDGRALPVFVVFASGDTFDPAWAPHIVSDTIFDNEGEALPWRYISNAKGSVTDEFCALYVKEILHPALGYPKPRALYPGEQGVIVCDGVGSHLSYSVVKMAIDNGMEILLRVPNLSFALQGEDTINFKELKAWWRKNKWNKFTELNKGIVSKYTSYKPLDFEHFMPCFLPAWKEAFTVERNLMGWELEGLIPFTRRALWRRRGVPGPEDITLGFPWSSSSSSIPRLGATPSSASMPLGGSASGPNASLVPSDEETPFLGPRHEVLPTRCITMSEKEREAFKYATEVMPPSGPLSLDNVLPEYLKAIEFMRIIGEWHRVVTADEPAPREGSRITSRNIFGLPGSATGEEAMRRLKEKEDEKTAAAAAAAAKKVEKDNKKAKDTATQVTLGSDMLKKIEHGGGDVVKTLSIPQLHALLVNSNPLASIPKPNKKVGIEKVMQLDTVKTAILRYATSRLPVPEPHTAPPPPETSNQGNNIDNLQYFITTTADFPALTPFAALGPDPSDALRTPSRV